MSPCFVCSVHVPRAFGWLPPVRLHCPVSSQPPGDRMLRLWQLLLGVTQLSLPLSLPAGCLLAGRGASHPLPVFLALSSAVGPGGSFLGLLLFLSCLRVVPQAEPALGCVHSPALPPASAQGEVTSVPLGVNYSKPDNSKTCQHSGKGFIVI